MILKLLTFVKKKVVFGLRQGEFNWNKLQTSIERYYECTSSQNKANLNFLHNSGIFALFPIHVEEDQSYQPG